MVVTAGNQPAIKFYTSPTTIKAGQRATAEIVVSGEPGLPSPSGQVNLTIGNMYSNDVNLGSNGMVAVQTTFPSPLPADTIRVHYSGDTVYVSADANFPLTNPPLPGGGPQPTPAPISTTTTTSTPTGGSTPTPTESATPTPSSTTIANSGTNSGDGTSPGNHPADAASNQGNLMLWIVLGVFLVVAVGGSGVFIVLRKRTRAASRSASMTYPFRDDYF